jgi:hypothetical protein
MLETPIGGICLNNFELCVAVRFVHLFEAGCYIKYYKIMSHPYLWSFLSCCKAILTKQPLRFAGNLLL